MKLRPSSLTKVPTAEDCTWPHGKDIPRPKILGNLKPISTILPFSWMLINKNTTSGNGIAPSQQSLCEYLLAVVPVISFMIISLSLFPSYYVVFVFLCVLFFLVHTYWIYLSTPITFCLPFFLAHTWNLLALCHHPRNPRCPPCHRGDPSLPWGLHLSWTLFASSMGSPEPNDTFTPSKDLSRIHTSLFVCVTRPA